MRSLSERTIAWWRAHQARKLANALAMIEALESRAGEIADERHKGAMDAWYARRSVGPMPDWNRIREALQREINTDKERMRRKYHLG